MALELEAIRDALTCAEIVSSFDAELVPSWNDSIRGNRPTYIVMRGRIEDLNGKHFSERELQLIATDLDEAFAKVMRNRAKYYLNLIRESASTK